MEEVDLLISKPGGLTLTEAILKTLPMMVPFYIEGQEEENLTILVNEGIGIHVSRMDQMAQMVMSFIENPDQQQQIKQKMRMISKAYDRKHIAKLCDQLLESTSYPSISLKSS